MRDRQDVSDADRSVVEDFRRWYLPCNEALHGALRAVFYDEAAIDQEAVPITSRHKTPESSRAEAVSKLDRIKSHAGHRGLSHWVPTLELQDAAVDIVVGPCLGSEWETRVEDMREEGTNYGYRAVHVIGQRSEEGRSQFGEVQIRTRRQEVWAQMVERLDKDFGYDLKHGNGRTEWLEWLQNVSDELRKADLGQPATMPPAPLDLAVDE